MPNYYTNVLLMYGGWDPETEELWDAAIVAEEMKKLGWAKSTLQRVRPAPYPDSLKSQREAHGIKWDISNVSGPVDLPGDSVPMMLTFTTAWGPPNAETREALIQELRDVYRVKEVAWVGMDPYSDEIGVERWPQSRAEEE